jgi:hypothetical protein
MASPPTPLQKGEGSFSLSNPNDMLKTIIISNCFLDVEIKFLSLLKINIRMA